MGQEHVLENEVQRGKWSLTEGSGLNVPERQNTRGTAVSGGQAGMDMETGGHSQGTWLTLLSPQHHPLVFDHCQDHSGTQNEEQPQSPTRHGPNYLQERDLGLRSLHSPPLSLPSYLLSSL